MGAGSCEWREAGVISLDKVRCEHLEGDIPNREGREMCVVRTDVRRSALEQTGLMPEIDLVLRIEGP